MQASSAASSGINFDTVYVIPVNSDEFPASCCDDNCANVRDAQLIIVSARLTICRVSRCVGIPTISATPSITAIDKRKLRILAACI